MPTPKLITIPISHYCEKARWALDRAGIAYREEGHAPLFHWRATVRLGRKTVPILVTEQGTYTESTEIVRWADARMDPGARIYPQEPALRKEVDELVARFDTDVGPATRRLTYFHVLPDRRAGLELVTRQVPAVEARLVRAGWSPIRALMRRGLKIDRAGADRSRTKLEAVFADVEKRLGDRPFLVGDSFSAADLTFAALAAPILAPPEQRGMPLYDERPQALREEGDAFRNTTAGAFALRMWREQRRQGLR